MKDFLIEKREITIVASILISFIISVVVIPMLIKIAKKLKLVDIPNDRKEHKTPTPTMGGIGVILGFLIASLVTIAIDYQIGVTLTCVLVISGMGVVDDLKDLSPKIKFLIQFIIALIITSSGLRLESLHGLFGIEEIPLIIQYLISILLIVGVVNAFNLLDGIDGLVGGIAAMNAIVFGILFSYANNFSYALLCFALAGSLVGFLIFNLYPAKIFMGDTGALSVGLIMTVFALKLTTLDSIGFDNKNTLISLSILILPVFDTVRVFSLRLIKGFSPFKPDKTHVHHMLVKTGYNHFKASVFIYTVNMILIVSGITLSIMKLSITGSLLTLVLICFFCMEWITIKILILRNKRKLSLDKKLTKVQEHNYLLSKLLNDL